MDISNRLEVKALCKDTNKWCYGYYYNMRLKQSRNLTHSIIEREEQHRFENIVYHNHTQVLPDSICQYVGQMKNKDKLYEGDCVKISRNVADKERFYELFEIVWNEEKYGFAARSQQTEKLVEIKEILHGEIVGNIKNI